MENIYKYYSEILEQYKNIIFYGNSGSGKTYNTLKTIEYMIGNKNYFKNLEKENRLKYISFHKMFSYNNFIERKNENIFENGIFKEMCINASLDIIKNSIKVRFKNNISTNSKVWKIYLGYRRTEERIYNQAKKDKEIVLGWLENESLEGKSYNEIYSMLEIKRGNDEPRLSADVRSINSIVNEMKVGDFALIYQENNKLSDIGLITSNYFHDYGAPYPHKRKVVWLKEFKNYFDMDNYDKNINELRSCYSLNSIDFSDLREIMNLKNSELKDTKPYFLVIDNIDKGDIFSIFGETIELISKNKRDFSITLYQSNKKFSIPENIYIIGNSETNIKDLTIKNKFAFIKTDFKVNKIISIKNMNINLTEIIEQINNKILELNKTPLSYGFISNINNIDELYNFWYTQLIPYIESLDISINEILGSTFINIQNNNIKMYNKAEFVKVLTSF
ncbi:MAG: hypothetical protein U0354_15900 [Candidatus Sericytochromatia bacterium]